MCPNEYHHLTFEFKNYFKIIPSADDGERKII